MSEEPKKKKIVLKKKGAGSSAKKPVIKLNKPPAEEELESATKVMQKEPEQKDQPESKPEPKTEAAPKKEETSAPAEQPESKPEKAEGKPFKFYCVYCGQKLSASTDMTGRKISCPSCGHKIDVPQAP